MLCRPVEQVIVFFLLHNTVSFRFSSRGNTFHSQGKKSFMRDELTRIRVHHRHAVQFFPINIEFNIIV